MACAAARATAPTHAEAAEAGVREAGGEAGERGDAAGAEAGGGREAAVGDALSPTAAAELLQRHWRGAFVRRRVLCAGGGRVAWLSAAPQETPRSRPRRGAASPFLGSAMAAAAVALDARRGARGAWAALGERPGV